MPQPAPSTSPSTASLLDRLPGVAAYSLEVVGNEPLTPSMRRLRLHGAGLGRLGYQPGQDVMVNVPTEQDQNFRRRYTIRRLERDDEVLTLDICLHGDGPGARWAAGAAPGSPVEVIGPRGKITLEEEADWHLFCGDESALPAFAAMLEALPPGSLARALIEVGSAADVTDIDIVEGTEVDIEWLGRDGGEPGDPERLRSALAELPLPDGRGHAYLSAELQVTAALRTTLVGRGLAPSQLSPKPYWRRGVANAAHGEPPKEEIPRA